MARFSRRSFSAAAALIPMALAAGTARAETRLRFFWWGNPERDKRTFAVVDLYKQKRPEVQVDAEAISWNDYWPKMATQAAGRNLPDVVQMDYRYMFEYARRRQLEPLDDYLGKQIDLSNFDEEFVQSGVVDGKLYAIPMGGNSTACYYDKAILSRLGITMPDHRWTWDDLRTIAREIKKQAPDGYAAVADKGIWEPMLEFFLRQRGKALYTEGGELAYDEQDVADYFGHWESMRDEGLVPAADVTARDISGLDVMPITTRKAVIDFAHSNQLVGLQALNPNELAMTMLPNQPGGRPGQYLKPAMQISLAAGGQNKEEAARLASFLVTDLDAAKVLRVERGVPGDRKVREFLLDKVDPQERKMIDYMAVVADNVSPLPPAPPKGAGEIETLLRRFYPQLAFGRVKAKEGAAQFYQQASSILRRA